MRNTLFVPLEMNRGELTRKVGMGADFRTMGSPTLTPKERFVGAVQNAVRAPNWTMPVIEQVRIHYDGPLADQAVASSFNATIDPLGSNRNSPPPGAVAVESTMAEPGKFQAYVLVTAIGWHFTPEPIVFTAKCNAFSTPASATAAPVSPDAFDNQDAAIGATGPLGTAANTLFPGWLDWGNWQEQAAFHMAHGYNFVWQMGNRAYLLNDSLKNTMYIPSNAQNGSASSSEQDVTFYMRKTNDYYRSAFTPTYIALPIERSRIGNFTLVPTGGTNTAGLSVFRPTRAYETVGATYGGAGVTRSLSGNPEFRRLTSPFLMKPGVPIGLRADVALNNSNDVSEMQQWLAASNAAAGGSSFGIPAVMSVDQFINAGIGVAAGGAVGMEPSLDSTVAAQAITTFQQRVNFKGGSWKLSCIVKGYELTDAQADMLKDPNVQAALTTSCGCMGSALGG